MKSGLKPLSAGLVVGIEPVEKIVVHSSSFFSFGNLELRWISNLETKGASLLSFVHDGLVQVWIGMNE